MPGKAPTRELPIPLWTLGYFYLAAAAVGGVLGAVEVVQSIRDGGLEFALPLGVGMSGWAIGRGLLRGSRRAWRWAQGLAGAVCAFSALLMLVALNADRAQLSLPWGARALEQGDPVVLLVGTGLIAFFVAQVLTLRSASVRRYVEEADARTAEEGEPVGGEAR